MDMELILSNNEALELPESFNRWRNDMLKKASELCDKEIKLLLLNGTRKLISINKKDSLKTLLKSIVRITRHICDCSEKCTSSSLEKLDINSMCNLDLKDLYADDKYYDNPLIDKRVLNNILVDRNVTTDGEELRKELIYYINNLCDDRTGSLRKLKCKAYELKDTCGSDQDCLSKLTYKVLPPNFRNCRKLEFSDDLTNIGMKIGDPMIFKRVIVKRDISQVSNSASMGLLSGIIICVPILITGIALSRKISKFKIAVASIGITSLAVYFTFTGV